MAFIVEEETGNIILVQGDSGKYPVENVPNDKHYTAYFGVYNDKRKSVGFEVNVDIPAYNAGQIVYDNDLYCWSYSDTDLYTLRESPYVGDTLYDDEGDETLYTIASVNSIVTEDGTYTRDSENNLNGDTLLYAWTNALNNVFYTDTCEPNIGDKIYDINGEETLYTVEEFFDFYCWVRIYGDEFPIDDTIYTKKQIPETDDYTYNRLGNEIMFPEPVTESSVYYKVSQYSNNEITCYADNGITSTTAYFGIDNSRKIQNIISINGIEYYNAFIRDESKDIKSILAYAWTYSSTSIYTYEENPEIGDLTYTYTTDLELNKPVSSIGSVMIGVNEYLRNSLNDIPKTVPPEVVPTTNIEFNIPASLTDFLKVPLTEETATYYFGIKLCDDNGGEDTLLLGDTQIGDLNTITVYPKKLEGTISNG